MFDNSWIALSNDPVFNNPYLTLDRTFLPVFVEVLILSLVRLCCKKKCRGMIWPISPASTADKKRNQTSSLPPGHHAFQFSFKIPPYSLPSSFESKHGYVRYWLKARIHRPWRFDEVTKESVKILSLIDVNCPRVLVSSEIRNYCLTSRQIWINQATFSRMFENRSSISSTVF